MERFGKALATVMITALGLGMAACSPDAVQEEAAPVTETVAPPVDVPASAAPALNDAEIAHIAVTANTIDADLGRLAEAEATSEEVKAFAATMVVDHTAVNEQAAQLAARLGVTPTPNDISASLQAGADEARRTIEKLEGAAFDRAYIDREVAYHGAVLDALDQTLIPGATNAELKGLLQSVRPVIAAHLERAREIQASLAPAS